MQKGLLLFLATVLVLQPKAQDFNTDSLLSKLKGAKHDTNRVDLLRHIGVSLAHKDPLKAIEYWQQGVSLSHQLQYNVGLARSFINIGTGYTFIGKYDSAARYTDSAIVYCHLINDKNRLALSYLNRADIFRNFSDFKKALIYCDTALIYADQTGNTDRLARVYDIIGDIYAAQSQYQPAFSNLYKALELYHKDENDIMVGQVYSDFADIYRNMGRTDSAISFYEQAIRIGETAEDLKNLSTYHADLGDLYLAGKNYREAEDHIKQSLVYAHQQDNNLQLATAYARLSNLYIDQKRFKDAIDPGKSGYRFSLAENLIEHQAENAALLAQAYAGIGDHLNANKFLAISSELKDSLIRQQFSEDIAGLQNTFEVKEKDKEIQLLNKEKELQQQRLSQQRILIFGSVAIAIMALIGIFMAISRYRIRNRMRELQLRNQIAADLHDEVGSSLSSIRMLSQIAVQKQGDSSSGAILNRLGDHANETMEKMSDIVWMINPGAKESTSLVQRMQRFMHELCGESNIETILQVAPLETVSLDMSEIKNMYLVYKEALNNAVKYAGARKIEVTAKATNKELVLEIFDNGKGFDPAQQQKGNGLRNMQKRAKELGGELELISVVGTGTTVRLHKPL